MASLSYHSGVRGVLGFLKSIVGSDSVARVGVVPAMALVDSDGNAVSAGGKQETLTLITNSVPAAAQSAFGGDYVWSVQGTFGGASVQLQSLGPDGTTYMNIGAAKTAADTTGGTGVGLGSNATVRAVITGGPPTGIYASLSRLP